MEFWTNEIQKGNPVDANFKRAFDKVPHERLLTYLVKSI